MIDSHAHLDSEKFDGDREEVLKRAFKMGVNAIINPGADGRIEELAKPLEIANSCKYNVFAAVGVHPQDAEKVDEAILGKIKELLGHEKVIALGEIGLEKSERNPVMEKQIKVLKNFVDLAWETKKPCIFHVRDAHQEFQNFLEGYKHPIKGVMHCFAGTLDDAKFYLNKGFYISVTGIITFPNAGNLRTVIKEIPLEKLMIETDAPFIAPQAYRGQRNEPSYVVEVVKKVAEIKNLPFDEVERIIDQNVIEFFKLSL